MEKNVQLFLLPYAGGSAFSFMRLKRAISPLIEAIAIEYSGHGGRHDEPYIIVYDDFVEDVRQKILLKRKKDWPYAILGYSMGSAIAFDLCCNNLLDESPVYMFFCAEGGLLNRTPGMKMMTLPEDEFKQKIVELGGIAPQVLNDGVALDRNLEMLRKDFGILEQFRYKGRNVKCDASVIYSPADATCVAMEDWQKAIDGHVEYDTLGDNHFFINQQYRALSDIINSKLV